MIKKRKILMKIKIKIIMKISLKQWLKIPFKKYNNKKKKINNMLIKPLLQFWHI